MYHVVSEIFETHLSKAVLISASSFNDASIEALEYSTQVVTGRTFRLTKQGDILGYAQRLPGFLPPAVWSAMQPVDATVSFVIFRKLKGRADPSVDVAARVIQFEPLSSK